MNAAELATTLDQFRKAEATLMHHKDQVFPVGTKVLVNADRYKGPGKASREDGCWADHLPVVIPNGNCWWYPLEACTPIQPT